MPEVILTENPWDNPWENPWENPRHRKHKTGRRRGHHRKTARNPRGGHRRASLQSLMSPSGIQSALDLERTGGIAVGIFGGQMASTAIKQKGIMDVVITIGAGAVAGSVLGNSGKFMRGLSEGIIALGIMKGLMLIPGVATMLKWPSEAPPDVPVVTSLSRPVSYPSAGVGGKITLAG